jgi:hypothetical protein
MINLFGRKKAQNAQENRFFFALSAPFAAMFLLSYFKT